MDRANYNFNPKSHPSFYNQKFLYLKQVCRSVKSKDGKANVTVALSCKTCPSFYRNDSKKINRITTVCIACYEHFLKFHGDQKQLLQLNDAMTPRAGRVTRRRVLSWNTLPWIFIYKPVCLILMWTMNIITCNLIMVTCYKLHRYSTNYFGFLDENFFHSRKFFITPAIASHRNVIELNTIFNSPFLYSVGMSSL